MTGRGRRVALYGGTFDPVHVGHTAVARSLLLLFGLDEVLFVPAFVAPHKRVLTMALISYPITSALHLMQPYLVKVAIDEHFVPRKLEGFGLILALFILAVVLEFFARFGQMSQSPNSPARPMSS